MAGVNAGAYAGIGVAQQQPQAPFPNYPSQPPQFQFQYYQYQTQPYAYGYTPYVPTGYGEQHQNTGTQTIGGRTEQSGTFKGHGTGASIQGGFTASGSIA
ncbi:zinc finger CCCH domain-containing protein 49-like [Senna tora]|uniref:Zinc finger CCCH domain-containing protein 49-like n=1 Tax=Senna tora TaxID=362788 RepID=A0A834X386_9FABA|nr:zinc finger CCCH domain-containing protein 49-like [Senna tora]